MFMQDGSLYLPLSAFNIQEFTISLNANKSKILIGKPNTEILSAEAVSQFLQCF